MVVLSKIYTRTGDKGTTALGSGERVPKHALRIAAYGTVDETNASIGMVRVHLGDTEPKLDAMLVRIQNDLFDLGADLCVPDRGEKLEHEPLRSFVLPGGTPAAAALHMARTISRRAERLMVELAAEASEPVGAAALKYINRLSDYLFVASRFVNHHATGDVLWVPGQNR